MPLAPEPDAFPSDEAAQSIDGRIEEQAARHPRRLAARGLRHALTYAELDRLANGIAHLVQEHASTAPASVALLLEHDAFVPAAQLGVLKARGIYVALEPEHPLARNAVIMEAAEVCLLLTDRANHEAARALAARSGARVVCVEQVDDRSAPPSGPRASGRDPAFLVFTSGSTGRPKGVCQVHRTVLHSVWSCAAIHRVTPADRISVVTSASLLATTTAIDVALCSGAAALFYDVSRRGPVDLAAWLVREEVSVFQSTPTLFRRIVQAAPHPRRFDRIRVVRFTGEAVTRTEWDLWRERFALDGVLECGLGSSEAYSIARWIGDRSADFDGPVLPVGRPLPGKELLLVDETGAAVAPGTAGEIVVRSEFLFAGYWRRPDLTARVLAPDPDDPRRQRFHTGDIGRQLPDGSYQHLGRRDLQVKVRGQRVEIAEVEQAVRDLGVADAAVAAHELAPSRARLVAFVAGGEGTLPDRRVLRARLREVLPEHMVPSAFVGLPALPLLTGGKIDRPALAALAAGEQARGTAYAPPVTPVEETLVSLVQQTLGVPSVGIDDDLFLDLGADSLAAVQILAAAGAVFGRELPVEVLADDATVRGLAERVLAGGWEPGDRLTLNADGDRPPLFAVCGAFGHGLRLLMIGHRLEPDQPFHALQPPAMDWSSIGATTIEAMAEYYVSEIRRSQPSGPYRLLGTSLGGVLVFEVACRLRALRETVAVVAMVDTAPPTCAPGGRVDRLVLGSWADGEPTGDALIDAGLRVARQHRDALERYTLGRRFDGELLYFRCSEPPAPADDRRLLWAHFAGAVRIVDVPGIHGRFHEEPQLSAVVEALRETLAAPDPGAPAESAPAEARA